MAAVFQTIKERNSKIIEMIKNIEVINHMYPFMTAMGVDALILLENKNMLLAQRSGKLCNMKNVDLWHVPMNEALSFTDIDYENRISLNQCVERGLKEELGIDCKRLGSSKYSFHFGDFFLVSDLFEVGITALVKIDISYSDIQQSYQIARDGAMETKKIENVSIKKIRSFMKKNDMTDACKYTLAMWYNRRDIFREL